MKRGATVPGVTYCGEVRTVPSGFYDVRTRLVCTLTPRHGGLHYNRVYEWWWTGQEPLIRDWMCLALVGANRVRCGKTRRDTEARARNRWGWRIGRQRDGAPDPRCPTCATSSPLVRLR